MDCRGRRRKQLLHDLTETRW